MQAIQTEESLNNNGIIYTLQNNWQNELTYCMLHGTLQTWKNQLDCSIINITQESYSWSRVHLTMVKHKREGSLHI